jgi:hypothetical protein
MADYIIMPKTTAFLVVTRFKEDYSWVKEYSDNYIIYNKSLPKIDDPYIINTEDIQNDLWKFVYDNYYNLPEFTAFLQGFPWDHCRKELFDELIMNKRFTPFEQYRPETDNDWERKMPDGGFMEINNNWYIRHCNNVNNMTCKYNTFDQYMNEKFTNYKHQDWLRFAPGGQYLVERKQILFYPRAFYEDIMLELSKYNNMTEQYVIERSLWLMWQNIYESRVK